MKPAACLGRLAWALLLVCCLTTVAGCAPAPQAAARDGSTTTLVGSFRNTDLGCGWESTGSMDLRFANRFTVDYYEGGFALACLADGARYLVVPEGASAPEGLSADICVLHRPIGDIYLVASDTMCLFDALNALDRIIVSGIARQDWYVESARKAMDEGRIVYGGKYSTPDYELLTAKGVRLAVESTMINHTPEVRDKLIELGIPVLTELSSYEAEPLGRAEWIRLYGVLCDEDELARSVFERQVEAVDGIEAQPSGKTVAYFYLNAAGAAVIRRPGDYITKMIAQAGGTYALNDIEAATTGASTQTIQMEQFYASAKDADILIYNGSIDDTVESLGDLLDRSELLADFKAVRNGEVWVTNQNMYQQMVRTGDIIADLSRVFHGNEEGLTFLKRLTD